MCACLSPVLPRMRAGVGGDEALLPILRRSLPVVVLKGLRVVFPLISETVAKSIDDAGSFDQPVPEVMADLMPEVTEESSIWLAQFFAATFALAIVGFSDVDCDLAVRVTRHSRS